MPDYYDFEYFMTPLPEDIGYGVRVVATHTHDQILENLPPIPNEIISALSDVHLLYSDSDLSTLNSLGLALYSYFFPKLIDDCLKTLIDLSRQNGLLRICFYYEVPLSSGVQIPLELIYSPHEQEFLSALPNIVIYRTKHTPGIRKQLTAASPIRCLMRIERPKEFVHVWETGKLFQIWSANNKIELTKFYSYEKNKHYFHQVISENLHKRLDPISSEMKNTGDLTSAGLFSGIVTHKPHIIHICAPLTLEDNEPLINSEKENQRIDIRSLSNFLRDKPYVRLMIFENVNSLSPIENLTIHNAVARRLLQAGVPCILLFANRGSKTIVDFILQFYKEIIENSAGRVDLALSRARSNLFVLGRKDYMTILPSMYMEAKNNTIFALPHIVTKLKIYQMLMGDSEASPKSAQISQELAKELGVEEDDLKNYSVISSYREFDPISIDVLQDVVNPKYPRFFENFFLVKFFSNLSRFSLSTPVLFLLTLATIILALVLLGEFITVILLFLNYPVYMIPQTNELLFSMIFVLYSYSIASILDRFRRERTEK